MKARFILGIVEKGKIIGACPGQKAVSIRAVGVITPIDMGAVEIIRIQTGVDEHWKVGNLQPRWWRFVDVNDFITVNIHAQPLSLRCRGRLIV